MKTLKLKIINLFQKLKQIFSWEYKTADIYLMDENNELTKDFMREITFTNLTKNPLALEILFKALEKTPEKYGDTVGNRMVVTKFEDMKIHISKFSKEVDDFIITISRLKKTEKQYQVSWKFEYITEDKEKELFAEGNSRINLNDLP